MAKLMTIDSQGMAKRGGLSELESNQMAMTKTYGFEKGRELPAEYEKIYEYKQNSAQAIVGGPGTAVILNMKSGQPYVPNVGSGNQDLMNK